MNADGPNSAQRANNPRPKAVGFIGELASGAARTLVDFFVSIVQSLVVAVAKHSPWNNAYSLDPCMKAVEQVVDEVSEE